MTIENVKVTLSDSGRILRIIADNERIIAEILVRGYLKAAILNAIADEKIEKGRINVFRGELKQLAPYEYLDVSEEEIMEKEINS